MNLICELIFCLTLFLNWNGASTGSVPNSNDDAASEIYEFWKEQDKSFHLGKQKDVVLFLGNTGAGKSTEALFVTEHALTAVVPSGNSDDTEDIYISDRHNKIGHETVKSHTLIPDLITDKSGIAYYDCPGFMDTRSPKHELTIAFFLNKLMTYAESFKLVFVVNHSSVKKGGHRDDFPALVRNAVKLVKDIEKYSEGIALVVTKVESRFNDTVVIRNVANFLEEVKVSLANDEEESSLSQEERKLKTDSTKFIAALLNKEGDSYSRIGIIRRPEEAGPLDKIPVLQEERNHLQTMINKNLKYVHKQSDDFGFVISPKSKGYIGDLTNKIINDGFSSDIANICREIEDFYRQKGDLISDVAELYEKSKLGVDLLSEIRTEDPRQFLKEILNVTYVLEIAVSNDTVEPILNHIESVDFLMNVVDQTLTSQLVYKINDIVKHFKNFQDWYSFLIYLEKDLSKLGFQNDKMKDVAKNIVANLTIIGASWRIFAILD